MKKPSSYALNQMTTVNIIVLRHMSRSIPWYDIMRRVLYSYSSPKSVTSVWSRENIRQTQTEREWTKELRDLFKSGKVRKNKEKTQTGVH